MDKISLKVFGTRFDEEFTKERIEFLYRLYEREYNMIAYPEHNPLGRNYAALMEDGGVPSAFGIRNMLLCGQYREHAKLTYKDCERWRMDKYIKHYKNYNDFHTEYIKAQINEKLDDEEFNKCIFKHTEKETKCTIELRKKVKE